jgi:DNA polymerase
MTATKSGSLDRRSAEAALRWWAQAGVDLAIDEAPHDRFAESASAPARAARTQDHDGAPAPVAQTPLRPAAVAGATFTPDAPERAERSAQDLAAGASSLAQLRQALESFEGCGLKATATQLVFDDGAPGSQIMFVGEAPGGDEDRIGRPFVGRAGQLLDRMLRAIELDRGKIYIANVVPWRPPGNRTPTPQETLVCLPFIRRQIALAAPRILVCLGGSAAQTLLGLKDGITRTRGSWHDYRVEDDRTIKAFAMLHPAYLLRQPIQKRLAWRDLRALSRALRS